VISLSAIFFIDAKFFGIGFVAGFYLDPAFIFEMNKNDFESPGVVCVTNEPQSRWISLVIFPRIFQHSIGMDRGLQSTP
tara:strand:- start:391 stop:627 length:237 start_codon:yes stop_codon:yes gene_type:complete